MEQYGCARMTVSKAMASLAQEGLIERRRKAGTFVAQPHIQTAILEIPDIGALIQAKGDTYGFELLARSIRKPLDEPGEAALNARGEVLWLEGLHMAAGRPFALERRIIALGQVPQAAATDFGYLAPGSWLLAHVPWSEARHRISAIPALPKDADQLGISRGSACLQLERWTWRLKEGVTFVRQNFPGNRFDLIAEFGPPRA